MIRIKVDNIDFMLMEYQDFSWLHDLGSVFSVYYKQDSGNLLFGVERDGVRKFVKYAGARTIEYGGSPQDAVERLKSAVSVYENIEHPNLINLEQTVECPEGLAAVFEWFDGAGLHEAWTYGEYSKYTHPKSAYYRYRHLPVEKRVRSINAVFEFLEYAESVGYVAVDLYDGSIMYDFSTGITKICDIDFYRKTPALNDIGADFWGSKRFKAPEEYIFGAALDAATNVYTLGAMIFHFLGAYSEADIQQMYKDNAFFSCACDKWEAPKPLYEVALKAVNIDRRERYFSVAEFYKAWKAACGL